MSGGSDVVTNNFYDLLIYWVLATLAAFVGKPIKCPPLLLYLIFGAVAGNLHWVDPEREGMTFFAEFSITMVFIALGLEESVEHFVEGMRLSWGIALIGALVPFCCGYVCALIFWFDYGWTLHITVATAVTATAVSLTMMILQSLGLLKTKSAVGIMSSAVLDDVGCLILVSILIPVVVAASPAAAATESDVPFDEISVRFIANSTAFSAIGTDSAKIERAKHLIAADISNVTNMSSVRLDFSTTAFESTYAQIEFTNAAPTSCLAFNEGYFDNLMTSSGWLYLLGDTYGPFTAYSTSEHTHRVANRKVPDPKEVKKSLGGGDIAWIIGKVLIFLVITVFLHKVVLPDHITEGWVSKIPLVRTYGIRHILSFSEGDQVPLIVVTFALALGMLGVSFGFHPAIGGYFAGLLLDEKYFDLIRCDDDENADKKSRKSRGEDDLKGVVTGGTGKNLEESGVYAETGDNNKSPQNQRRSGRSTRKNRSQVGTNKNLDNSAIVEGKPVALADETAHPRKTPMRRSNSVSRAAAKKRDNEQQQEQEEDENAAEELTKDRRNDSSVLNTGMSSSSPAKNTTKMNNQSVKSKLMAAKNKKEGDQQEQQAPTTEETNNADANNNCKTAECTEKHLHSKKRKAEENEDKGRDVMMKTFLAANEEQMSKVVKDDGEFDRVVAGGDLDTAKSYESYYPETPFEDEFDEDHDSEDDLLAAMDEAAEHAANNTMERTSEAVATAAFMWLGPVFFVHLGAGFEVDGSLLATAVPQALAITAILYVGQFVSALLSARYVPGGYTWAESALIGFGMLGRAELYFVVLNEAKAQKVIPKEVFFPMALAALFMNITLAISMTAFQSTYAKYELWEPEGEEEEEKPQIDEDGNVIPPKAKSPRQLGVAGGSHAPTVVSSRASRISRISRLSRLSHIRRRGVGMRGVVQEREEGVGVTDIKALPIESQNMSLIRTGFGYEAPAEGEEGEAGGAAAADKSDRKSVLGAIRAARRSNYDHLINNDYGNNNNTNDTTGNNNNDTTHNAGANATNNDDEDNNNNNNNKSSREPSAPRQGSGMRHNRPPSAIGGLKALRRQAREAGQQDEEQDAAGVDNNNRKKQGSTARRSSRPPSAIGIRFHRPSNFLHHQSPSPTKNNNNNNAPTTTTTTENAAAAPATTSGTTNHEPTEE